MRPAGARQTRLCLTRPAFVNRAGAVCFRGTGDLLIARQDRRHRAEWRLLPTTARGEPMAKRAISSGGGMRLCFHLLVSILRILPLNLPIPLLDPTSVSARESATVSGVAPGWRSCRWGATQGISSTRRTAARSSVEYACGFGSRDWLRPSRSTLGDLFIQGTLYSQW
jgi:hypothetical protein